MPLETESWFLPVLESMASFVQADRSGLVSVQFEEIRLLDGNRDESARRSMR